MEQLINEIEAYAASRGIKPATVLQKGGGLSGTVWATWVAKAAACTLPMADRLRTYMAANPVAPEQASHSQDSADPSCSVLPVAKDAAA